MNDTADPITVLRIRVPGDPQGWERFYLCPRSLARRWAADAAASGADDQATDLGPVLMVAQSADRQRAAYGREVMVLVGIAADGRWVRWALAAAPVEPVPGSPGDAAARN